MSRGHDIDFPGEAGPGPNREAGRDMPRGGRATGARPSRAAHPTDVRDVLVQQLALPLGKDREVVGIGPARHALNGSDVRVLATIGAFRVVATADLSPRSEGDRWHGTVGRLRAAGLIATRAVILNGRRTAIATLTARGKAVLGRHRLHRDDGRAQTYYEGVTKCRDLAHGAAFYPAYRAAAERLHGAGARIQRVVLDYELRREYQRFLQENNRVARRGSGRPDRSREEIQAWATAHGLPVVDGRVRLPDVRIEFEHADGRQGHEDIEIATHQYNSRQMAVKRASGFRVQRSQAGRLGGGRSRRGGAPFDPHTAEQVSR